MTIETSPAVAAGWYPDPAGSPQLRWWSGVAWTEYFAPPAELAPAAQPLAQVPPQSQAPSQPMRYDPSPANRAQGPMSNRSGWTSLVLGAIAVILVVGHLAAGQGGFLVTASGITSIIWGIRALVRRSNGQSTLLWAPILGIALGVTASTIMVFTLVGTFAPTATTTTPTTSGASATGSAGPHIYPANPTLSTVQAEESSVVTTLEDTVGGGDGTLPSGDAWPSAISVSSDNKIMTSEGDLVGTLPSGMTIEYSTASDGSTFVVQMHGADSSEISVYNSATDRFTATCPASDKTCLPM